ncbi:zinc-binding dehydrogenase [Actinoplanes sp. CA-051413]
MIDAGQVTPIIDTTYPLSDTPDAIRRLCAGQARGKLAVQI